MRYNIRQGKFSSGIHFGLHTGRVNQTYKVRFDSSCMYEDLNWERDYNKIQGWSYNTLPMRYDASNNRFPDFTLFGKKYIWGHHVNSLRLGWRANSKTNKIEICLYIYQDSKLTITDFTEIDVDKEYTLGVFYKVDDDVESELHNPRVILTCTQKDDGFIATNTINLTKPFVVKASYRLFPYFGGNDPAPHDMSLTVTQT